MVKKNRRKIFLTSICAFLSLMSYAQISIKGVVKDNSGQPLPGVSVRVKGTSLGVATSPDGIYVISAPANSTLTFSFIGYNMQEIAINNKNEINVTLADAPLSNLDEVVVVGYGTQKRLTSQAQ
ncbi:carboxypeptidase-like regulatory domain-containing protein [Pedobacter mendelii]|uniref:carboxypeptidase-like regulatory domain-containing protein n=1 Tax=Pedobacter mendelii TaxID=1908240 RepID=UPI003630B995